MTIMTKAIQLAALWLVVIIPKKTTYGIRVYTDSHPKYCESDLACYRGYISFVKVSYVKIMFLKDIM